LPGGEREVKRTSKARCTRSQKRQNHRDALKEHLEYLVETGTNEQKITKRAETALKILLKKYQMI
jgi:hypothetical protein